MKYVFTLLLLIGIVGGYWLRVTGDRLDRIHHNPCAAAR
jgi:hypothetical protein